MLFSSTFGRHVLFLNLVGVIARISLRQPTIAHVLTTSTAAHMQVAKLNGTTAHTFKQDLLYI